MTEFVTIEPGQWVLAFDEPYGPYDKSMAEHLERFSHWGGGWDHHRKDEIFHVYRVERVMPKTFTVSEVVARPRAYVKDRLFRAFVIATFDTKEAAISFRDAFFEIGKKADQLVEAEMHRRIKKFAAREEERALRKIHSCLPHIFGRKG